MSGTTLWGAAVCQQVNTPADAGTRFRSLLFPDLIYFSSCPAHPLMPQPNKSGNRFRPKAGQRSSPPSFSLPLPPSCGLFHRLFSFLPFPLLSAPSVYPVPSSTLPAVFCFSRFSCFFQFFRFPYFSCSFLFSNCPFYIPARFHPFFCRPIRFPLRVRQPVSPFRLPLLRLRHYSVPSVSRPARRYALPPRKYWISDTM